MGSKGGSKGGRGGGAKGGGRGGGAKGGRGKKDDKPKKVGTRPKMGKGVAPEIFPLLLLKYFLRCNRQIQEHKAELGRHSS